MSVICFVSGTVLLANGLANTGCVRCFRVHLEEEDYLETSHNKNVLRGSNSL